MESKKDLYDWFRYWTNGVSSNKPKPLNITVTQIDGKYPYKSKSKRLIKKWTKQHTLNTIKYKYCKVDMSKVSDFGSCNNEFTLNYNLTYIKNIGTKKMASKEAENYYQKVGLTYTGKERDNFYREELMAAFDAGVESVNKRINEVNAYYNQLNDMSEDYRAGYLQAEKDMPTQSEAAFEIIRLQKKLDALEEHNKWHRVDENPNDLPTEDKEYLVKVVFDVGTGNEHIFLAQWWNENKFWDSLYADDIVAWKEIN